MFPICLAQSGERKGDDFNVAGSIPGRDTRVTVWMTEFVRSDWVIIAQVGFSALLTIANDNETSYVIGVSHTCMKEIYDTTIKCDNSSTW